MGREGDRYKNIQIKDRYYHRQGKKLGAGLDFQKFYPNFKYMFVPSPKMAPGPKSPSLPLPSPLSLVFDAFHQIVIDFYIESMSSLVYVDDSVFTGTQRVEAAFGGGVCTIPATLPGAAEKCTSKDNGFCAIDTVDFANDKAEGKCICYKGYTGDMCQTKGQRIWNQISVCPISVCPISVCQISVCQISVGQISAGQISVGQISVGQMSVCQISVCQISVCQISICPSFKIIIWYKFHV